MSNTVSTDLARRLAKAGLKHEWAMGDWVEHAGQPCLVIKVYVYDAIIHSVDVGWHKVVPLSDCLWLPTLADCLERLQQQPTVYHVRVATMGDGSWYAETWHRGREAVPLDGDNPTEAAGLALLAVLEGEKEGSRE